MIDDDGYRPNVGIVICNRQGQVMWARRYGQHSWQFPQGGINPGETAEQAMYRELFEEVGLSRKDVRILRFDPKLVALQVAETFGALGHKAGLYRPETKVVSLAVDRQ
ncbi:RNA pyrophosphohydrolase [Kluyvera cryocrescens]|uniref:RNA pyrophosphohydrolase n=1 Tax=Kluyvera cryocrescens TaxID=580 RepID=A0A485AQD8_KLUCR|nr:RNA pyrophosphohydrolase [Kluyvera cryocrescens]